MKFRTYRDLKNILNQFSETELDFDVTLFERSYGEFYGPDAVDLQITGNDDVLDAGHPYFDFAT